MRFTTRGTGMQIDPIEARKLDIEVAAEMGLTFENGKFVTAYHRNGELSFRKFRTLAKEFWIEPKGAELHLWQIDSLRELLGELSPHGLRPKEALVFTEGEPDAVAIKQACRGVYVTSVPNGANGQKSTGDIYPNQDNGFRYLWGKDGKLLPELTQFDKIILAVDSDEKGETLRDELAVRLGDTRCWFVIYPDGCKDANDVVLKYSEETLERVIASAKPIRPGHLVSVSDLPPYVRETTYSTGWGFLDNHIQVIRPELFVITGIPGSGKTQWARSLMFHLSEIHGWKIGYLTPEDNPHRLKRDIERFAIRNQCGSNKVPAWVAERTWISRVPEDEILDMPAVFREMESAALHHDCQAFLWDPWNEVYHDYGHMSETQYTERMLMQIKRKARRFNLAVFLVAHPKKREDGQRADLYSINGSAAWYNKADHGIIIHRPTKGSRHAEIETQKTKDHEVTGEPGKVWVEYHRGTCDYTLFDKEAHDRKQAEQKALAAKDKLAGRAKGNGKTRTEKVMQFQSERPVETEDEDAKAF